MIFTKGPKARAATRQKHRKLIRLLVWVFGIRMVLSDEIYPDSYDEQWPQASG
jgi:hypothetical protein